MLDHQTLEQLLEMEIESFEGNPAKADISSLIEPAKAFENLVYVELLHWCNVHLDDLTLGTGLLADCNNAKDVVDVMMQLRGGAPYLYWMEQEGHGVGTWDSNEWENLFKSEDTEPLSNYMLKVTKASYSALKEAMTDAAVATIDNDVYRLLRDTHACNEAKKWAKQYDTIEDIWNNCNRGDWLLWLADAISIDGRLIMRAAVMCSNLLSKHVPTDDELVRNLFKAAITYCDSEGTYLDQVDLKAERGILARHRSILWESEDINLDYLAAIESLLDATGNNGCAFEAAAIYRNEQYYPIDGSAEVVRQYITAEMIVKQCEVFLAQ